MLAIFCLRLAMGLLLVQSQLPLTEVHPRFFRTQYLVALGLTALAGVFLHDVADVWLWLVLAAALLLALVGSMVWLLEGARGGRILGLLTCLALAGPLVMVQGPRPLFWGGMDHISSALLLGSALSAMLLGHSYLVAPTMSLTPLLRVLAWLMIAWVWRLALAGIGLWLWTGEVSANNLETETVLWLITRWLVGFLGPLVLGWMAWESAKINSTQSATGILYVVVVMCFLGELLSLLLLDKTGFVM